ncbi:unnamed protein product [Cunninghamella echinulata]
MLKEQSPPKAVNIVRPHSPLFNYFKPRSTSPINQQNKQQQQQQSSPPSSNQSGLSYSTSTSASSSPSTISTLSGGSTLKNTNNKIQTPTTILNTSTLGFSIFQAQQNSTSPPSSTYTSFFKSPPTSPPTSSHYDNIINNNNNNNNTNSHHHHYPSHNNNHSNKYTSPTSHGFMNGFTPRFLRVRPTAYEETLLKSSTLSSADIQQENENTSADENDDSDIQDDYDSIDGNTDSEEDIDSLDDIDDTDLEDDINSSSNDEETDDDIPIKIVAKVKNGTIMNGKGVLVNRGNNDDDRLSWLDDPRASRKIADLEIEKSSLMALNNTLESKVREQADRIAKLEKQLQINSNNNNNNNNHPEWPLSPVSDKDMDEQASFENLISTEVLTEDEIANDQVFQRLRSMLLGLIEHAEEAVRLKTKVTGRVLTNYSDEDIKESFITLDSPPILKPSTRTTPYSSSSPSPQPQQQQHGAPTLQRQTPPSSTQKKMTLRRASDVQDRIQKQTNEPQPQTRKRTPMERSLSRASSPAVLVSTDDSNTINKNKNEMLSHQVSRPASPKLFSPPMQRSSTRPRSYHQRRSQDMEYPKWHN